jgi:hypothetical protein
MRPLRLVLAGAVTVLTLAGCVEAPKVVQGRVVRSEGGATGTVVVKDEVAPNAEITLSLQGCEIGADPQPGDEVRISYLDKDGGARALRVMNLTRQAEVGRKAQSKSGGH